MTEKLILKELSRYKIGTYADIIYRNALLRPENEAFISGNRRITFSQYNARVNSLVHGLRALGLQKRTTPDVTNVELAEKILGVREEVPIIHRAGCSEMT